MKTVGGDSNEGEEKENRNLETVLKSTTAIATCERQQVQAAFISSHQNHVL